MYPGASAEVIANTVGIPIEQAVNGVEGSIYMSSTSSSSGNYTLTVTFAVGTNLNAALTLVQNMVNGATAQLPETVQSQGVTVRKVSTNILQVISIYSDDDRYDATYLSNYAIINLQYPLGRLAGVGQIQVFGAGPYSMRVWLDPNKLKYYNLTTLDVVHAIQQQNVQVVAGRLGAPPVPPDQTFQFTVNALGRLADAKQFEDIIVKSVRSEQGETAQLVRVKDIARVDLDQQFYSNFGGLSGKQSGQILVYALPGANAIDVGDKVKAAMAEMSQTFPEGLKYAIHYDTTEFIGQAIHAVYETLFEAGILVLIVIMVFLQNWRAMLVPATTVPVTIIGAFAAMALLGFTGQFDDPVRPDPGHRHRGGRRHRHRRERLGLHRERLPPARGGHQGHAGVDRPGHRHHPGAHRGIFTRRLHAGHHRAALPAIRPGHRLHRHHQRPQRPDPEADPVRPLAAPPR